MSIGNKSSNRSPWIFFLLVFILAIPFWLFGMEAEQFFRKEIPINLPISALMFVCPMIAALILAYRNNGADEIKHLLKESFNKRIDRKIWYVPIFLLMPIIMILAYVLMNLMWNAVPNLQFSISNILTFFFVFFIAGICEELGWQGFAYDKLENRWSAIRASIILGVVWQIWHVIPHIQAHHPPEWIIWQCTGSVSLRILIVWLYKNTGKSILAAAIFHAMNNVCSFLFPNYDSSFTTFSIFIVTTLVAIIVTFLWGSKTLARFRFKHSN
ncbi:CPBP family intramembrane glutamic endopeptidase [Peribacillus sp. NPDC006672]|uniref:CPBP family intramembrane glutamic endopeptidase n=1 Tax=Peribacillus sp. NPDC006672 TaxID=3390606 RepID=UPI003D007A74